MPEYNNLFDWVNSPYYHLLQNTNASEKSRFLIDLINHLQPANDSKVLQVSSGTGWQTKSLSEMGYDVTGIDYSFTVVDKAKQLENDRLHFYQHDVRLPFWINYFHYAFHLTTSFGYFNTVREHDNIMRTIAQSLILNGTLVIDTDNVHYRENNSVEEVSVLAEGMEFKVNEWQDTENFYKRIMLQQDGVSRELFTEKVLKYSIGDFTDMLAYQGLQIQEVFGDYTFADYNIRTSPRLVLIAKKIRV